MGEENFLDVVSSVGDVLSLMSENAVFFIAMSAIFGLCFVTWCLSKRKD